MAPGLYVVLLMLFFSARRVSANPSGVPGHDAAVSGRGYPLTAAPDAALCLGPEFCPVFLKARDKSCASVRTIQSSRVKQSLMALAQPHTQTVRNVMTLGLTTLPTHASVLDAVHGMRDANSGMSWSSSVVSAHFLHGFGQFNLRTLTTSAFVALPALIEARASGDRAAYATRYARARA
jgi:hypothetical protein